MLDQLSPQVAVTKFGRIAEASKDVVSTNLPASELDRFIALALKAKAQPVATVSFVPPLVNTGAPDIDLIQDRVEQAMRWTILAALGAAVWWALAAGSVAG